MPDPERLVFEDLEWPYGLRCYECGERFTEGQPYTKLLEGFVGDTPVTRIVCVACGMGLAHA